MTQAAGRLALRYVGAMEARVATLNEERGRIGGDGGAGRGDVALGRQFRSLSAPQSFRHPGVERPYWRHRCWYAIVQTWPGLDDCLRVTVGTPGENDRFLAALRSSLEETS
jgi:histidinol-phosphate aminotransferase